MPGRTFTISEAAEALGMSKEAVRKRIQRGSLKAEKRPDGTWMVFIDPDAIQDMSQGTVQDDQRVVQDVQDGRIAELEALLKGKDETIQALQAHISTLQAQLEDRNKAIERQDILMANLQRAVLPAPRDSRPLWQRLFRRSREG